MKFWAYNFTMADMVLNQSGFCSSGFVMGKLSNILLKIVGMERDNPELKSNRKVSHMIVNELNMAKYFKMGY